MQLHTSSEDSSNRASSFVPRVLELLLGRYFLYTVTIVLVASAGVVIWKLQDMSYSLVHQTAVRDASAYSEAIAEFRTLYTSEVVARLQPLGIKVSHDYDQHPGAIPLPATLSKLLGDRLGHEESQCNTRLYSDYPFPWRKNGGPQDDFERDALRELKINPNQPYYRFETNDEASYLRYAAADKMQQSCVQCHNTHPESPKTDWQVGDVRGVLAVRMPLTNAIAHTNSEIHGMLVVLAIVGGLVIFVFGLTMQRLRNQTVNVRQTNDELTRNTRDLAQSNAYLQQEAERREHAQNELVIAAASLQQRKEEAEASRAAALNMLQDIEVARQKSVRAEQQQAALNQELEIKAQQIATANTTLERSNEELKQFAYVASHDLQEPLRKVNSFCQLLQNEYADQLDDDAKSYIRYAVDGATRMRNLVSDLLDYSRVETQGRSLEPTDAGDACSEAIDILQSAIEDNDAKITVQQLPTIQADRAQLVRLFQNLIGNAIKYRGDNSPNIRIGVEEQDHDWVFSICDNGIGMEHQYHERIFVMFQRLHARDEYSGTGIGLAICKRIVDRLWGRIWVESEPGVGSTFFISVPKLSDSPEEGATGHEHSHPVYAETH